MHNRIAHLLNSWPIPETGAVEPHEAKPETSDEVMLPLPRGVNMLMPVELCINRELLITLLTASIQELHRHRRAAAQEPDVIVSEIEAALGQQLAFRSWARNHPARYISIAMYPIGHDDPEADLDA